MNWKILGSLLFFLSSISFSFDIPPQLQIKNLRYGGSGCAPRTVKVVISGQHFQIAYDDFIAIIGPNTNPDNQDRDCSITIELEDYDTNWQYSVYKIETDVFTEARPKVEANIHFAIQNGMEPVVHTESHSFKGPMNKNHKLAFNSDEIPNNWSKCGRNLILYLQTFISIEGNDEEDSFIQVDLQSGAFDQEWGIKWKKCGD